MPTIKKTLEILTFIERVIAETGESPIYQDIAKQFGFRSVSSVHDHVKKMELRGWITRTPHESRAIRVVERKRAA